MEVRDYNYTQILPTGSMVRPKDLDQSFKKLRHFLPNMGLYLGIFRFIPFSKSMHSSGAYVTNLSSSLVWA